MKLEIEVELDEKNLPKNVKIGNSIISFYEGVPPRYLGEQVFAALAEEVKKHDSTRSR